MMVWKSSIYFLTLLMWFEASECSRKSASSASPAKKCSNSSLLSAAAAAASSPLRVDLNSLADFAVNLTRSPLRVLEKNTKFLALDFGFSDEKNDEDNLLLEIFYPKEESIFTEESWNVPLNECGIFKNLMNLGTQMRNVRKSLEEELFDDASSFSWVSDAKTISNYVSVVSVSLTQLSYLISRLNATKDCPPYANQKIRENVLEHLKVLAEFSNNLRSRSGITGMSIPDERLNDPSKYFKSLLMLRNEINLDFSDSMFECFIEFIFDAYASAYFEEITGIFLDNTTSERWIPLPIKYLSNRGFAENYDGVLNFIGTWTLKAFSGSYDFDTRNLVNVGFLMQQGLISCENFNTLMKVAEKNHHTVNYTFDENLIKFLTLTASTPYLLPNDPEIAILIGNFASPHGESVSSPYDDSEKVEMIVNYWEFFVGSANGLSLISEENYTNLVLLIKKLDRVFPGISEKLWSTVDGFKANEFYLDLESDMISFKEIKNDFCEQAKFIEDNFSFDLTIDNNLADSKSLYLMLEFFTNLLIETLDVSEAPSEIDEYSAYRKILDHCAKFFESLFSKHVNKAMIAYWYSEKNYYPTGLFSALFELWSTEYCEFLSGPSCLLWENLVKLVDYNEEFAHHFMTMLISYVRKTHSADLCAKLKTPKCLLISGQSDALNLELFRTILEFSRGKMIPDVFFSNLSSELALNEISFGSAELLLRELESDSSISIDMKGTGYVNFWGPATVTNILGAKSPAAEVESCFRIYMKIYKTHGQVIDVTTNFLRNISTIVGFNRNIWGLIDPHAQLIGEELLSQMTLSLVINVEEFHRLSLVLHEAFYILINNGLPMRSVRKLFEKLLELTISIENIFSLISGSGSNIIESEQMDGFVYSYNSLLMSILRIPNFTVSNEEKTIPVIFEFLRNFSSLVPELIENLVSNIKSASTIGLLYSKMVSSGDYRVYASMFDTPLLKDKKQIKKLQTSYVNYVISDHSTLNHIYLTPIVGWIKNGKVDSDVLIKLFGAISPEIPKTSFYDYFPLFLEFFRSPHYPEPLKIRALKTVFSEDNDELIRDICNRRNWVIHDYFLEIFMTGPWVLKFLESCDDAVWYQGLITEIGRLKKQKIETNGSFNTANFYTRSSVYVKEYFEMVQTPLPDYYKRAELTKESDKFIEATSEILPLLHDSDALRMCYSAISNCNWEISDGHNSYFRAYGEPRNAIKLIIATIRLFHKTPSEYLMMNLILESIKTVEARVAVVKMLPKIFKVSNFVISEQIVRYIYKWFVSGRLEDVNFEEFITNVSEIAFEMAQTNIFVLDELFSLFYDVSYSKKTPQIPISLLLHSQILDNLTEIKSQLPELKNLMQYFRLIIEKHPSNEFLCSKVMTLLKDLPELYLREKISWIIIWKQLHQSLQFEFIESKELVILSKLGNHTKFIGWRSFISKIHEMNLPSNVLVKLVDEITESEPEDYDIETVLLLPERLRYEDFESYSQMERIIKWINKVIDSIEDIMESDDFNEEFEFSSSVLKKLLLLIDFETQIGEKISDWSWRRIFNFVADYGHHEEVFIDSVLNQFPNLIEKTNDKTSIVEFIYELKRFMILRSEPSYEALISKSFMIYNKFSNFEAQVIGVYKPGTLNRLKSFGFSEDLNTNLKNLKEVKNIVLQSIIKGQRQDELAVLGFNYIFHLVQKLFAADDTSRSEVLSQICDLIVEILFELFNSGANVITMARSLDESELECLILDLSKFIEVNIEKYSYLIREIQKFALFDVSENFFYQISESKIRVDVCFITTEAIKNFDEVTRFSFMSIDGSEWIERYIERIINEVSNGIPIDPKHFDMLELLIDEINEDLSEFFEKLTTLIEYHLPVLSFIEKILVKEDLESFYENFMTDEVTQMLISDVANRKRIVEFIKNIQKLNPRIFETWKTNQLQPQISDALIKTLQEAEKSSKSNLFTVIAERMINKLEEYSEFAEPSDILKIINSYKSMDINLVDSEVLAKLYNKFIEKLTMVPSDNSWNEVLRTSVCYLLGFPTKLDEKILNLAVRAFTEDIFVRIVNRVENAGQLHELIEKFSSKIDAGILKTIKVKLNRFGLHDNFEIMRIAANNSEPAQMIEYLQKLKNLPLEMRFRLLSNCKVVIGFEEVSRLINYFKTFLTNNPEEKEMIVMALLENNSILSCFTNATSTNNKTHVNNKSTLIEILLGNLNRRRAILLADRINNPIGKLLINLYFKASSCEHPLLPEDFIFKENEKLLKDFLINYLASIKEDGARNRTSMFLKAFKLYELIDGSAVFENLTLLGTMADGLYEAIQQRDVYMTSPLSIYVVYKLTRRLPAKKKERYLIMRRLLVNSTPRRDCFSAFLRAQLESSNIDWELNKDLLSRLPSGSKSENVRILLKEFEQEHKK